IDLSLQPLQKTGLVLAIDHGDDLSALQGQETNMRWPLPAQQPLIVSHRALRTKHGAGFLVTLERFDSLPNGSDRHLGRQPEAVAQLAVTAAMDRELGKDVIRKTDLGSIRRRRIKSVQRFQQGCLLVRSGNQLELQCEFHAPKYRIVSILSTGKTVGSDE